MEKGKRTVVVELDAAQDDPQQQRVGRPLALNDGGAYDEQTEGDVDAIDIFACKQ